jgi:hypothetical protein
MTALPEPVVTGEGESGKLWCDVGKEEAEFHDGFRIPDVCTRGFDKIDHLVVLVTGLQKTVSTHTHLLIGENGHVKRLRDIEMQVRSAEAQVRVLKWVVATAFTVTGAVVAVVQLV